MKFVSGIIGLAAVAFLGHGAMAAEKKPNCRLNIQKTYKDRDRGKDFVVKELVVASRAECKKEVRAQQVINPGEEDVINIKVTYSYSDPE